MLRRPPRSTRTAPLFPYTTRFRSHRLPVHLDGRRMTDSVLPHRPDGVGPDDLRMPCPGNTVARQKIQPQRDNLSVNVNARFCNPSWACCILGIGGSRRARASHTCVLPENRLFLRKGGPDRFRTSVQPSSLGFDCQATNVILTRTTDV